MSLDDLHLLDDDALDALVSAADPLLDEPEAGASSPDATAMLAAILDDDVQPLPLARPRRRRGPVLFAAVALAAGAAAAGTQLLVPSTDEPFDLVCHASVDPDGTSAVVTADDVVTAEDAIDRCRAVLASGELGPAAVAVSGGQLVVCEADERWLAVHPAASCADVGRGEVRAVDPAVGGAPSDFAAVRTELAAIEQRLDCPSPEELVEAFDTVSRGTPAEVFTVVVPGGADVAAPRSCASLVLDAEARTAVVTVRPWVLDAEVDDTVADAIDAFYAAMWEPDECVTAGEAGERVAELLDGTAIASFTYTFSTGAPDVDACVELRAVDEEAGTIVLTPRPDAP